MDGTKVRSLLNRLTLSGPMVDLIDRFSPLDSLGKRGEREAERFLLRLGMVIVARGFADKFGEIDLIAVDGETIVFVEVKTRSSDYAGLPVDAIDETKRQHMTKTAISFLKWNKLVDCSVRFDVISVLWPEDQKRPQIDHYLNAFEPVGKFQMF